MIKAVTISLILSFPFVNLAEGDSPERKEQIEEYQERLRSKRSEYENLAGQEKDQIEKLRSIEEQIALSNQLILKINRESGGLKTSITERSRQLDFSIVEQGKKKLALYRRMKYVYKHGNKPAWLSLISSGNPTEAIVAFKNIRSIMEYDRQLVLSLESMSQEIKTELVEMKNEKELLEKLEKDYEEELGFRKSSLSVRKELLEQIRSDKSAASKAISDIEDDIASVSAIFEDLDASAKGQKDYPELTGLENGKGNLIWPIQGKIIRSFGTTKDKRGIKLTNPGIDVQGSSGDKVLAAAMGRAIYISWLRGYGQFIILDHGLGYYTLYSNLSDIYVEIGDLVKAGEVIAEIGDLGSLEGSRLHFELRYRKESLDPIVWLR